MATSSCDVEEFKHTKGAENKSTKPNIGSRLFYSRRTIESAHHYSSNVKGRSYRRIYAHNVKCRHAFRRI